jgi:hypothetical protein
VADKSARAGSRSHFKAAARSAAVDFDERSVVGFGIVRLRFREFQAHGAVNGFQFFLHVFIFLVFRQLAFSVIGPSGLTIDGAESKMSQCDG